MLQADAVSEFTQTFVPDLLKCLRLKVSTDCGVEWIK